MKKLPPANQLSLFGGPAVYIPPEPPAASEPVSIPPVPSLRAQIVEQIVRDSKVLTEEPGYAVPSREFFEQRIAWFKEDLARLDRGETL